MKGHAAPPRGGNRRPRGSRRLVCDPVDLFRMIRGCRHSLPP
ncbi:hypothetical protein EKH55_2349 [Sinorhizobium alkalisoli]|nr:hypothetical protein EKH55_2349 [Sinorhizobium alkalisoli]